MIIRPDRDAKLPDLAALMEPGIEPSILFIDVSLRWRKRPPRHDLFQDPFAVLHFLGALEPEMLQQVEQEIVFWERGQIDEVIGIPLGEPKNLLQEEFAKLFAIVVVPHL